MDDFPRWLDSEATAAYISVRATALPRLVREGRVPKPSYTLGPRMPRWDKLALDAHFDGGAASTDVHTAFEAALAKIQPRRARRAARERRAAEQAAKAECAAQRAAGTGT